MTRSATLVLLSMVLAAGGVRAAPDRPNILLIVSEDNGPELGCYGDPYAQTPVLDRLAADGVRFAKAFVPYSVCSPSRACFLTGLYPHQNGQIGLATHKFAMFPGTPTLPAILRRHGYRTGLIGKLHVNPEDAFPFDFRKIRSANFARRDVREYAKAAAEFFGQDDRRPFFLSINYPDAHFPLHRQQFGLPKDPIGPSDVRPLPWVGIDSPRLRKYTANYYNCMRRLDDGIGMLLQELRKSGEADRTLVVYIGDHGAQFSRGKCSMYEAGLRIPMIVSWPGKQTTGLVRNELVSTLDLVPTFLMAAGLEAPGSLPGESLQPLLKAGPAPNDWRQHIVGFGTGGAPGIFYLQQSIRDQRYKLILNPLSGTDGPINRFAEAYLKQSNPHFAAGCTAEEIARAPKAIRKVYDRFLKPPPFELYDLDNDPTEFQNLANSPDHVTIKKRLLATFRQWQRQSHDPFADPDKLRHFTRSQLDAIGSDYRSRKTFRWPYLDNLKPPANKASAKRPNVLFIAIDDLRPELGCYGDAHIVSPNIDALAASSVRFDRAYCQQAICGPSRASLLTGLRPDSVHVHGNHTHYRSQYPAVTTLPQHFKNHGYHTRAMGKINHGVFPRGSSITVADTFGDEPSWSIPAFRPGPRYYYTEEGIAAAKTVYRRIYRPKRPGPDDWTRKLVFGPATEAPDVADSILYDGQVADRAVASIAELSRNRRQPFFLAVGFIKPHSPYIAPKRYWDLYDPAKIVITGQTSFPPGTPRTALHPSGELRRYTDQPKAGPITDENQRRVKHAYFACISYIDAQIGRVLASLEEHDLSDDTVVVLWGDHGYHLGEQNLWGKTTNFELDTRVPLILRAPGRRGNGHHTRALVELVDLYPTLAELCGLPVRPLLEGSSLVPLLDHPNRPWKTAAFSQYTRGGVRGYSIRTAAHRYTEWRNLKTHKVTARELYEYEDGLYPVEPTNIAEAQPDLVESLSRKLGAGHGWKTVRRERPALAPPGVRLAAVFTDHMVLPRDRTVPIWGTASSGTKVTVAFAGQKHTTTSDRDGRWQVALRPLPANPTPSQLTVNDRILQDILVGDVWFCSGQSNMRWTLKQSKDAQAEIAGAEDQPTLRLLDLTAEIYPVSQAYERDRLRQTTADNYYQWSGWDRAAPAPAATFSAVAWHFGKRLLEQNPDIPVGLIHNAIGGTPMESWIPETTLLSDERLQQLVTIPWHQADHPRYPRWCGLRGRQNLARYFDAPDGPVPNHPFKPGFLYDAGVRPFARLPVTGIIWYQGESNATQEGTGSPPIDPAWNHWLFTTLIRSWREAWRAPELPFVFAQLPGLNRDWPLFREMQLEVARADPNVHMAVTIDAGHPTNVHPVNKRPVGRRMAELALGVARRPAVTKLTPGEITFDRPVQASDRKPIRGFQLAGADKVFHPATASTNGRTVVITSDHVPEAVAVRYGWENNPDLNLAAIHGGHPVSPFRSDRWEVKAPVLPSNETRPAPGFTGFETPKAGPLTQATFDGASWSAPVGQAEILPKLARTGRQCLHLVGGKHSQVEFVLPDIHAAKQHDLLTFAAERWTRRDPFRFRVEAAKNNGKWEEIYNGDKAVRVGRGYLNQVTIELPAGTRRLRMTCTSPPNTGILIDDMNLEAAKPMKVMRLSPQKQTIPLLIGQKNSPLLELAIETQGRRSPKRLTRVTFALREGVDAIEEVRFAGQSVKAEGKVSFKTNHLLVAGSNLLPLTCELSPTASLDGFVSVSCLTAEIDGQVIKLEAATPQRRKIGVAVRQRGQDGVHTYRIPGLTTTKAGTLIAVYDNRNRGGGDLPGDVDVGMSRSTDGGQTWEPMKVIMDMGNDPAWRYDGVGDPSILTDRVTGTIWVAATWSHGDRSWRGSGPGMKPEETGQLMLAKSTDDGKTWSKPINITSQVKVNPKWRFVLQGPGRGITLRDGTLVFPAQFRGENGPPVNGKPFSTIIYSQDRGETWRIGSGVRIETTEAQAVQLGDGSIMINCRDNRGGSRSVYTTRDLGRTWTEHPTSRKALREPVCNAGLLGVDHPRHGPLLFFSNPDTTRGRHHFTLKVSRDQGMTWPKQRHVLYDERLGNGYSILTPVGKDHIGVLYEGRGDLYFLRFPINRLLGIGKDPVPGEQR